MRERAGEVVKLPVARRRRSNPQKIETRSSGRIRGPCHARDRRSPRFDLRRPLSKRGITGRANREGHRPPGQPTICRAESGMAVASGANRDGQVATALRRSRTLGLPVPTQAKAPYFSAASRPPADGDTWRVCKRAICRYSNRSRQQPWRPRRWQSGARRIRPCWGRSIQWN